MGSTFLGECIFTATPESFENTSQKSEAATGAVLSKLVPLNILQISQENTSSPFLTKSSGLQLYEKVSPTQLFSFKIFENFKGCPFLITYTSGSNWYICFNFVS